MGSTKPLQAVKIFSQFTFAIHSSYLGQLPT